MLKDSINCILSMAIVLCFMLYIYTCMSCYANNGLQLIVCMALVVRYEGTQWSVLRAPQWWLESVHSEAASVLHYVWSVSVWASMVHYLCTSVVCRSVSVRASMVRYVHTLVVWSAAGCCSSMQ